MIVMSTLVICQDSPDAAMLRETHLQAHLDYIEKIVEHVEVAGPICQSDKAIDDKIFDGSIFIYATDNIAEARQLFANDPYALAGVYESFTFSRFMPAAGEWLGGTSW